MIPPVRRPVPSLTVAVVTVLVSVLVLGEGAVRAADPTTAECVAASDAAIKDGDDNKLRSERSHLLVCAAASCPADIRKDCGGRVDAVNAQIPTLLFEVKGASGTDLSAVKVTMDGEVLAERLGGGALAVDPGEHAFTFETAGEPPVTKRLMIQQGQRDRREGIAFGAATAALAAGPSSPVPIAPSGPGLGTQKILALVAGGVGVVGLGLGTAFGFVAISQKSAAQSACPGAVCANQSDVDKWNSVASSGTISTAGFIIGGVALAGGAVLWLTAPSSKGTSAQVDFGPGVLQVKGTW